MRWTVAIVAIGAIMLVLLWDWNWFKGPLERRIQQSTGRSFSIGGDLDVDLQWPPLISAEDVVLGNPAWSAQPTMATAERIDISLALWPLLRRELVIPTAHLSGTVLTLERDAKRRANWQFESRSPRPGAEPMQIGTLSIEDGELRLSDQPLRTELVVKVASGKQEAASNDTRRAFSVTGSGRYRGEAFNLDGQVESPLALRDRSHPYLISLDARAGATRASARGALVDPFRLENIDAHFALSGDTLADLYPLLGIALPSTPPYELAGTLLRDGDRWRYQQFQGRVGDSDLSGSVDIDVSGERPSLDGALVSRQLDFDDLAGFIGAPPSSGGDEAASAAQEKQSAQLQQSERVLPQRKYELDKLRAMDVDVTLRAAKVDAAPLPIDSLDGHLLIVDGVARLDPLELGVAGGRAINHVTLDASNDTIVTTADIALRGLQLPRLFPDAELTRDSAGRIGGRLQLKGRGNSVAAMLATSDGEIALVMGRGRISNLLLELAGLDLAEAFRFLIGKDRIIPVRCGYADFAVDEGSMTVRKFAFDTTDTLVEGEGSLDLADESLDLLLRPQPKDRSLVSLRSPLRIGGSFKDPSIRPQGGPLALRGAAAAVLYSIAPPAILLALLETGPGEDADCGPPNDTDQQPPSTEAKRKTQ